MKYGPWSHRGVHLERVGRRNHQIHPCYFVQEEGPVSRAHPCVRLLSRKKEEELNNCSWLLLWETVSCLLSAMISFSLPTVAVPHNKYDSFSSFRILQRTIRTGLPPISQLFFFFFYYYYCHFILSTYVRVFHSYFCCCLAYTTRLCWTSNLYSGHWKCTSSGEKWESLACFQSSSGRDWNLESCFWKGRSPCQEYGLATPEKIDGLSRVECGASSRVSSQY